VGLLAVGLWMIGAGLHLPSGGSFSTAEIDLPPCTDKGAIMVIDLAEQPRSTCDPTGNELILPDGHRMKVVSPLVTHAESSGGFDSAGSFEGATYSTVNLGIYGVCVAKRSADNTRSWWWGRAEAVEFCQEYGKDAPTNHD
jgi:hypothetical protein